MNCAPNLKGGTRGLHGSHAPRKALFRVLLEPGTSHERAVMENAGQRHLARLRAATMRMPEAF